MEGYSLTSIELFWKNVALLSWDCFFFVCVLLFFSLLFAYQLIGLVRSWLSLWIGVFYSCAKRDDFEDVDDLLFQVLVRFSARKFDNSIFFVSLVIFSDYKEYYMLKVISYVISTRAPTIQSLPYINVTPMAGDSITTIYQYQPEGRRHNHYRISSNFGAL